MVRFQNGFQINWLYKLFCPGPAYANIEKRTYMSYTIDIVSFGRILACSIDGIPSNKWFTFNGMNVQRMVNGGLRVILNGWQLEIYPNTSDVAPSQ